jgi:hypothetical protein
MVLMLYSFMSLTKIWTYYFYRLFFFIMYLNMAMLSVADIAFNNTFGVLFLIEGGITIGSLTVPQE